MPRCDRLCLVWTLAVYCAIKLGKRGKKREYPAADKRRYGICGGAAATGPSGGSPHRDGVRPGRRRHSGVRRTGRLRGQGPPGDQTAERVGGRDGHGGDRLPGHPGGRVPAGGGVLAGAADHDLMGERLPAPHCPRRG